MILYEIKFAEFEFYDSELRIGGYFSNFQDESLPVQSSANAANVEASGPLPPPGPTSTNELNGDETEGKKHLLLPSNYENARYCFTLQY